MPDGDVIKRGVRHAWRAAYDGLSSGGADLDARGLVAKGLTGSIRKWGMPRYVEAASLVDDAWNRRVTGNEALARVATVVGTVGGTRNSALLDVAVKRAIIAGPTGAHADQAVVEAYLKAEVDAELMAKVRPAMLESGERDPAAVEQAIARWIEESEEPIRQLAQQIVADPSGRALRAPPSRRGSRKNTAEILDETV